MVKYKIVLSAQGKRHYKGGNITPMKKPLNKCFSSKRNAEKYITKTLGSASHSLYNFKKI